MLALICDMISHLFIYLRCKVKTIISRRQLFEGRGGGPQGEGDRRWDVEVVVLDGFRRL